MALSTEPLIPPGAGDYQRMGLRTTEFRPLVIRRALERSAQPLALMHLRSPNAEVERLLLGVMVSAYRVLDPRRREDPLSRIMLGRMHPQLADEAVQLAQARMAAPQAPSLSTPPAPVPAPATAPAPPVIGEPGDGLARGEPTALAEAKVRPEASPDGSMESPFSSAQVEAVGVARSDVERLSASAPTLEVQLITSERFLDATVPGWDKTLSSLDLLVQPMGRRMYRTVRRRVAGASFPSKMAAAILAASVLVVSTWRTAAWLGNTGDPRQVAAETGADLGEASAAASASAPLPIPSELAAAAEAEAIAEVIDADQVPGMPLLAENLTAAEDKPGEVESPVAVEKPGAADSPAVVALAPAAAAADLAAQGPGEEESTAANPVSAVGDNASGLISEPREVPDDESLAVVEAAVASDDEKPLVVKLPAVPPEEQLASARLHVETLIRSQLENRGEAADSDQLATTEAAGLGASVPGDVRGAERQILLLQSVAREAEAGSAERWVAMLLAGQAAMLAGRAEDAERVIGELSQWFEIGFADGSVRLAQWAASDVLSEPQRQVVAAWIDEKVRFFVLDGDLAIAGQLVGIAQELGTRHRDEAIKAQSKLWRDSLAVAQRYAEAAQRLGNLSDAEQASAEERGLAGRYWSLVRRDWHRALPHLAAGSNAKLAHFAGIELLAGSSLDAQDATMLADGYVGEAKKAKGWLSDSYVLHAHELLVAAAKSASETKSLELAGVAEKLKTDYARAFHDPAISNSTQLAGLPAEVSLAEPNEQFMLGRVRIAGQDVGALVRYEPGMTLGTRLIDLIATELKLAPNSIAAKLGPVEMEFVGVIRIDQPTTVSLSLLPLSDGGNQRIAIDGQVLPVDSATTTRSSQRYDVDLLRGDYLLRWTATLAAEDRLSLRVNETSSGERMRVVSPPAAMPGHPGRLPTRLRVSLVTEL